MFRWTLHGDGRHVAPEAIVLPEERLAWPLTIGIGAQHVVAMFGATFLVPLLTGFPPSTTLLFSGDRKSTRLNSSHVKISYAVFCLKKKKIKRYSDLSRCKKLTDTTSR